MHNYKELKIWQRAIELSLDIYRLAEEFPASENYNLASQIKRAAVSVPSNIAEGTGRNSDKDFLRFLGIALGSVYEVQTQLVLSNKLKFISTNDFMTLNDSLDELAKMIWGFKKNLESNVLNLKSY
jgi:four helix bundle protein